MLKRTLVKLASIIMIILSSTQTGAQESQDDASMLENLRKMRTKQQQEEVVIREQRFVHVQNEDYCTPVQEARERLKDIDDDLDEAETGDVTINAGHGDIDVTDNHGTINSDINIQVINQGEERKCL